MRVMCRKGKAREKMVEHWTNGPSSTAEEKERGLTDS